MQSSIAQFRTTCIFVIIFGTTLLKAEKCLFRTFSFNDHTLTCSDLSDLVTICQNQSIPVDNPIEITKENEGEYFCCCGSDNCVSECVSKVAYGEQTKKGSISSNLEFKWGDPFNIPCAYTPGALISEPNADEFYELKWIFTPEFEDGSRTLFPQAGNAHNILTLDRPSNTIIAKGFNPLKDQGTYTCTVELKQNDSSSSFTINVTEATDSSISTSNMNPPTLQITSIEDGTAQFNCLVEVPSYKTIGFLIVNLNVGSLDQRIIADITDNSCTLEGNHTVTCASNEPTHLTLSCSYDTPNQINCSLVMRKVTEKHSSKIYCFVVENTEVSSDLFMIFPLPAVDVDTSTRLFLVDSYLMPTIECYIFSSTTPNVTWTVNNPLVSLQQPELIQRTERSLEDRYISTLTVNKDIMGDSNKIFTCTVTNANGSANDSLELDVYPPIPYLYLKISTSHFIAASLEMPTIECTIVSETNTSTPNVTWTVNDPHVSLQQPELMECSIDDVYNSTLILNRDIMGDSDKYFTCSATNAYGSVSDGTWIGVSVGPPVVTIVADDNSITLGFGDSLVLTCTADSAINTILTWVHPMNQPLTSNNTFDGAFTYKSTIMIPAVNVTDGGSYICIGSNAEGSGNDTVQVDITVLPVVSVDSSTINFIAASLVMPTIECTIFSFTPPNVTWTVNDPHVSLQQPELMEGSIDGVYSSTLTVNRDIMGDSDKVFTCTATNVNGSDYDSQNIQVFVEPPVVTIVDDSITIGFGDPLVLTCTSDSAINTILTWVHPMDQPLTSNITFDGAFTYNSTIMIPAVDLNDRGSYTCVGSNAEGSGNDTVQVDVTVNPPVIQPIPSQTVTVASNVSFFCNASSDISITYLWSSDPMLTQCDDTFPNCILGLSETVLTLLSVPDHFSTNLNCNVTDSEGQSSFTTTKLIVEVPDTSKWIPLQPGSIAGIAVAGSVVIMLVLICCATIPCLLERKLKKLKSIESSFHASNFEMEDQKDLKMRTNAQQHNEKLNKLNLLSCVIDPSDLKLMEKVGQGEFGIVYRGILRNDSSIISVAIKTVRGLYSNSLLADELFEEAEKMKSFDHLHVLSLTGVCVGLLESPCIVMPFMSNGSLLSYLRKESVDLTINEIVDENLLNSVLKHLLSICLQVAKGMDYLSQQKFVHRDLAARNCMLSSEGIIKIADFGLAEDVYTTEYFKQVQSSDDTESVKLPLKWMALESIHLGKFDEKTDVWSYGVLCWEVFNGGKTPYPGSTPREVVTMLDNGERLTKPTNAACTEEVFSVMLSCWEKSPECRPCFFELVEDINKLLVPLADYLEMAPDFKINNA